MKMITEKEKIELELQYLSYSRYVSRAHTIFSSGIDSILATIFGTVGIVISLVEIGYIKEFNTFYFIRTLKYSGFIILCISVIAFYKWYNSRIIRGKIINKIKQIQRKS